MSERLKRWDDPESLRKDLENLEKRAEEIPGILARLKNTHSARVYRDIEPAFKKELASIPMRCDLIRAMIAEAEANPKPRSMTD